MVNRKQSTAVRLACTYLRVQSQLSLDDCERLTACSTA